MGQGNHSRAAPTDEPFAVIVLRLADGGQRRMKMGISQYDPAARGRPAWNAGRQVGAKRALKVRRIWAIRFFLDREGRMRDRALLISPSIQVARLRSGQTQDRHTGERS